ncbi:DUF2161 family putative PD-(D/E)XK-type phosphodiesterase [Saccharibacillus sp. CPCC 101409]|uniref:DUF2161 family putative PD-(D/E)XK-type phosphodiesterase n=1 Tax=Saccharibacillus sp. CPCC 101409 TaxID=3058041 RepID=UPI0026735E5D|nr:DUF2161 family putative PD-(D/E)XK-type phosphodiesterase [Saccharibacillus sp. CPCC 101409]MDO3408813.1 DUF2161 family putative PD-(D/E)XK-type phosphodiesterase [Saccharibacillus sp. CPCC 101409]
MAVKYETELYPPLKLFFEQRGYAVKSEVRHCDLVGYRENEVRPLIVEIKKTFTLELLLQGADRQRTGGSVYLAVERNRDKKGAHNQRFGDIALLCRRLGLGLITVTFYKTKPPFVEVLCEAGESGSKAGGARAKRLKTEFEARSGDHNIGGANKRKIVTAYRENALKIARHLWMLGEASPLMLKEASGLGKAAGILRDNHYGWFERVSRGRYRLTESGRAALNEYAAVVAAWTER